MKGSDPIHTVIERKCQSMDVPMVGFAPVSRWEQEKYHYIPIEFRPEALFPGARTAIVLGIPIALPAISNAPSAWYNEVYKTVNALLDQCAYRLATFLNQEGLPSVYVPRDGYPSLEYLRKGGKVMFSHRHAAVMAGLGSFGLNNTVVTPEYGPRVRFVTVLTRADLQYEMAEKENVCTRCGLCVKRCPVNAISGVDYPQGIIDKEACSERSQELKERGIAPCGICIAVCPVGQDRVFFDSRKDL